MVDNDIKVRILTDAMPGKKDSIWYANSNEIAFMSFKDREVEVFVDGDVRVGIFDKDGRELCDIRNRNVDDLEKCGVKDDKELNRLENEGLLIFDNNNWFSVYARKRGGIEWDTETGEIHHNYDEALVGALELLKDEKFWRGGK